MLTWPFVFLGTISPSDYSRHSTRTRKVTNYNINDIYGLSDEEDQPMHTAYDNDEDEDAIEMVLDHRQIEGTGKP